jgi:DNA end-binding protein Ku
LHGPAKSGPSGDGGRPLRTEAFVRHIEHSAIPRDDSGRLTAIGRRERHSWTRRSRLAAPVDGTPALPGRIRRIAWENVMAARPYWRGQIRLALVSIPVEIYSATKSGATIAFNQIHEPSGKRIKYEKVVPGIGPVDVDEIVKGFEYAKGEYVLLDEKEIEGVKLESKKTLELTQFVDTHDIDPIYFEKPFYVVPADDLAEEAFIVLREALRRSRKIGLGQLAMRGREYVVSVKACGRGLVMETLRYADEVNKAASYFRDIGDGQPDDELLDLATTLIDKKTGKFDASDFHDRYVDALKELIERKKKGKTLNIEADEGTGDPRGANVVDLMAALKKSLGGPGGSAAKPAKKRAPVKAAAKSTTKKTTAKTHARKRA